ENRPHDVRAERELMCSTNDAQVVIDAEIRRVSEWIGPAGRTAERESAGDGHQHILWIVRIRSDADIRRSKELRSRLKIADAVSIDPKRIDHLWADQICLTQCQRLSCDVRSLRRRI